MVARWSNFIHEIGVGTQSWERNGQEAAREGGREGGSKERPNSLIISKTAFLSLHHPTEEAPTPQ